MANRQGVFKPDIMLMAAEKLNLPAIDLVEYFCDANRCPTVAGGVFIYRDSHHITATFARTLSSVMEKKLALGTEHQADAVTSE